MKKWLLHHSVLLGILAAVLLVPKLVVLTGSGCLVALGLAYGGVASWHWWTVKKYS